MKKSFSSSVFSTLVSGVAVFLAALALPLPLSAQSGNPAATSTDRGTANATTPQKTNRYSMKLSENEDGTYSLINEARYAKIVDLSEIPDLYTPYTHESVRLRSKDYKNVETEEFVYKKHDSYELKIAVDKAVSDTPSPVMFYLHGGGWARGSFDSARSLSRYLAQQKGVTGVRVSYTLAPQPGANVEVSIQDVLDAVEYVRSHSAELNVNPDVIGFYGTSAGAHLAAVAAMKCPRAKVFVGVSGIYDLTTAAIAQRTKDAQRIAYFEDRDPEVLRDASPYCIVPKKKSISALLFCGTADIVVECSQSREFARKLQSVNRKNVVDLQEYRFYDHNLGSKSSDRMEEIFFKTVDFVAEHLK